MASTLWIREWSNSGPLIGRWRRHCTSCKVIVISPTGKWKEDVSLFHRSTKAPCMPWLMVVYPVMKSPLSPEPLTASLNHSAVGLNRLKIFRVWLTIFNGALSCYKKTNKKYVKYTVNKISNKRLNYKRLN